MENGFFLKQCSPRDTGIPLEHDYIFIKEVDTPDGVTYQEGGGRCHTRLLVFGEGGWRWQDIKFYTFDLFTLSINIH